MRYFPSLGKFCEFSRKEKVIPVYKELPVGKETPISAFTKLPLSTHMFILESVERGGKLGRYSFLGTEPSWIIRSKGRSVEIEKGEKIDRLILDSESPLELLKKMTEGYRASTYRELGPFSGGAVGYLGYDMVCFFEKLPETNVDDIALPDLYFIWCDDIILFDHKSSTMRIVANAKVGDSPERSYGKALERIERLESFLNKREEPFGEENVIVPEIESNFKEEDFCEAVRKAKKYIKEGEILQVVLSQRLKAHLPRKAFSIYRALRTINPSPYMFYLKFDGVCLIGSSPEILVRVAGDDVTIRPIAGTRRRGKDLQEDRNLEKELLTDEKERAEHVMLVDLGRNDLGRVAKAGTVKVSEFMAVERYSHVMHIVSNITGKLKEGMSSFDVLRASFPAGTVSGAPKIRAMEIIDELEPTRRGPYAGAVGYFSISGNMDTCITIRTILVKGEEVYVQAGAGIVADSVPEREYQETMNKAKALIKALSFQI